MPGINVYLPDPLYKQVKDRQLQVSTICQEALEKELARMIATEAQAEDTERIEIQLWRGGDESKRYTAAFQGKWLVYPNDESTTDEPGHRDTYYGVAVTAKKQIAVYVMHGYDAFEPTITTYGSLEEAAADGIPSDILAEAAAELGNPSFFVVELDI